MDINGLAKKYNEQLNVDEMKSLVSDLADLSMDELSSFVDILENKTSSSSTAQPVLNTQSENFIKDVALFFDTIIARHGEDGAQTEHILEQYDEEFSEFAQVLATFQLSEIKEILVKLDTYTTHPYGGKIAEQLVSKFEDILNETDFFSVVNDPAIEHLY